MRSSARRPVAAGTGTGAPRRATIELVPNVTGNGGCALGKFPESCWAVLTGQEGTVGHIALTFIVHYEDDAWQGLCRELHVPSFGDSPAKALENTIDATICYLNELEHTDQRETVFKQRHIIMSDGAPGKDTDEKLGSGVLARLQLGLAAAG